MTINNVLGVRRVILSNMFVPASTGQLSMWIGANNDD